MAKPTAHRNLMRTQPRCQRRTIRHSLSAEPREDRSPVHRTHQVDKDGAFSGRVGLAKLTADGRSDPNIAGVPGAFRFLAYVLHCTDLAQKHTLFAAKDRRLQARVAQDGSRSRKEVHEL